MRFNLVCECHQGNGFLELTFFLFFYFIFYFIFYYLNIGHLARGDLDPALDMRAGPKGLLRTFRSLPVLMGKPLLRLVAGIHLADVEEQVGRRKTHLSPCIFFHDLLGKLVGERHE